VVLQVAVGWPGVRFGGPWRRAIRPPTASLPYLAGWAARTTPEVLPTWGIRRGGSSSARSAHVYSRPDHGPVMLASSVEGMWHGMRGRPER